MQKEIVTLDQINLIGLTVRTNNKNEIDPKTSKIATLAQNFWQNNIANQFQHRITPGITYAVYTDYESDEHGDYTYFIGEAVSSLSDQDEKFTSLITPTSKYQKLTTPSGKLPDIIISAWHKIWQMTEADFGGKRRYLADFEIYDKALDPFNASVSIYIGIK